MISRSDPLLSPKPHGPGPIIGDQSPVVSNLVASNVTATSATIGWNVAPAATGQVEYGLTASYGSVSSLESNYLTAHSQGLSGLSASTTYHYRVHSVDASGHEVYSGDLTFQTSAAAGASVYGSAFNFDTKNNCRVGTGVDATSMSYRYKAPSSSTTVGVVWQRRFGAGYSAGTGGTMRIGIQADDGTASHFPSGTYLGSTDYAPGSQPAGNKGIYTALPSVSQVAGTLYHLVFLNVDGSPASNYFSVNNAFIFGSTLTPRQPAFADVDFGVLYKNGPWAERTKDSPDFDLVMADGTHIGSRYIASNHDAGSFGTISGASNMVRERFTVTGGSRLVTKAWLRPSRASGTSGLITVTLIGTTEGTMDTKTVSGAGVPVWSSGSDSQTGSWLSVTFSSTLTLVNGREYKLQYSTDGSSTYYMVVMLTEDSNDDPAHHMLSRGFTDGVSEKTTNGGGSWSPSYSGFPNNNQFYFETV